MSFVALLSLANAAKFLRAEEPIPSSYVIVFHKNITLEARQTHLDSARRFGSDIKSYSFRSFNAYSAKLDGNGLSYVLSLPEVDYVEENGVMRALCDNSQASPIWGVARTGQRERVDETKIPPYGYDDLSDPVFAYVIDTGIRITHKDYNGRAIWGYNAVNGVNTDENGHGSHCAGTIGGIQYGVAKSKAVTLVAVKVLDASGSGSYAGVIDGITWAATDHAGRKAEKPGVANLSLGGGKSQAVNDALDAGSDVIMYAVAAGNSNANACNYSPASASRAFTVGATDSKDARASFSNFGTCMHIFGPGVNILSAYNDKDDGSRVLSGTSMATPHVCGVAAKIVSESLDLELTTDDVKNKLKSLATPGIVVNPGTGSPNLMIYHSC